MDEQKKKTDLKLQNLEMTMKQMQQRQTASDTLVSNLQAQVHQRIPSQPYSNPKDSVNAITLRSGKELKEPKWSREVESEKEIEAKESENEQTEESTIISRHEPSKPLPPFPSRLRKYNYKAEEANQDILDVFRKVEINIPLLDALKQVPRSAKFLKELCTSRRKMKGNEKVSMRENVSAVLQKKLLTKCKDPGIFSISCKIGNMPFDKAMLDLGSSINVMSRSLFEQLKVGELKRTGLVIHLGDKSCAYPDGVIEDVLDQVDKLIFPADFFILDMGNASNDVPILLGRLFLKIARTKIDVCTRTLSMEFDGDIIKFDIFDA